MKPNAKELVEQITDYVNTFSLNPGAFNEAMSREHRTLQQSFTRLCLKWLENCASDDYRHDLRNQDSHDVCKAMIDAYVKINGYPPSGFLGHV